MSNRELLQENKGIRSQSSPGKYVNVRNRRGEAGRAQHYHSWLCKFIPINPGVRSCYYIFANEEMIQSARAACITITFIKGVGLSEADDKQYDSLSLIFNVKICFEFEWTLAWKWCGVDDLTTLNFCRRITGALFSMFKLFSNNKRFASHPFEQISSYWLRIQWGPSFLIEN